MTKGEALAAVRKGVPMTQGDLADKCNMKQSSISRIENGTIKEPTPETIARILGVLGEGARAKYNVLVDREEGPAPEWFRIGAVHSFMCAPLVLLMEDRASVKGISLPVPPGFRLSTYKDGGDFVDEWVDGMDVWRNGDSADLHPFSAPSLFEAFQNEEVQGLLATPELFKERLGHELVRCASICTSSVSCEMVAYHNAPLSPDSGRSASSGLALRKRMARCVHAARQGEVPRPILIFPPETIGERYKDLTLQLLSKPEPEDSEHSRKLPITERDLDLRRIALFDWADARAKIAAALTQETDVMIIASQPLLSHLTAAHASESCVKLGDQPININVMLAEADLRVPTYSVDLMFSRTDPRVRRWIINGQMDKFIRLGLKPTIEKLASTHLRPEDPYVRSIARYFDMDRSGSEFPVECYRRLLASNFALGFHLEWLDFIDELKGKNNES